MRADERQLEKFGQLFPGPLEPHCRTCSLGRPVKSGFLFIFSDYLCIISIFMPTLGSRVRTVARLAVWETLPGLNDVNPLFTQNRERRKI